MPDNLLCIAICVASAQPKAQVSGGVECLLSKSKSRSQIATTLAHFWALASDCTENRGLLVAQALLQVTAKLAQQANSLSFVKIFWLTAHCFASQPGSTKESGPHFTDSTALLRPALFSLAAAAAANCCPADNRFSRSKHLQGQRSATIATGVICRIGMARTASQIELSLHRKCSATQKLVLNTDF